MKTPSGFQTNGTYIKYQSGYTKMWYVETEKEKKPFHNEGDADTYIRSLGPGIQDYKFEKPNNQ